MIKYESDCYNCDLPCTDYCSHENVPVHYCDKCGKEMYDTVYEHDGQEICEECCKNLVNENMDDIIYTFQDEIMQWLEIEKKELR